MQISEFGTGRSGILKAWDRRSSVRARPRRTLSEEMSAVSGFFFNPDLVRVLGHPVVQAEGEGFHRRYLALHLIRYLEYTDFLELEIVNPALVLLIREGGRFGVPRDFVLDGYKIYVDEGYHAHMSIALRDQVAAAAGLRLRPAPQPGLQRLAGVVAEADAEDRGMLRLLTAVCSETLVSGNLSQADDDRLLPAVRDVIRDHADDERTHHAYFSRLFRLLWTSLDGAARARLGVRLPDLLCLLQNRNVEAATLDLAELGLAPALARRVATEALCDADCPEVAQAAAATLALFQRVGVFDEPRVHDAFAGAGLLAGADGTAMPVTAG